VSRARRESGSGLCCFFPFSDTPVLREMSMTFSKLPWSSQDVISASNSDTLTMETGRPTSPHQAPKRPHRTRPESLLGAGQRCRPDRCREILRLMKPDERIRCFGSFQADIMVVGGPHQILSYRAPFGLLGEIDDDLQSGFS